jgi:hypothetical protein
MRGYCLPSSTDEGRIHYFGERQNVHYIFTESDCTVLMVMYVVNQQFFACSLPQNENPLARNNELLKIK